MENNTANLSVPYPAPGIPMITANVTKQSNEYTTTSSSSHSICLPTSNEGLDNEREKRKK